MGVGIESGRNNTTERLHLTWCTSLRAVVTYHAAAGRREERESYYCRSIRPSWNVRTCISWPTRTYACSFCWHVAANPSTDLSYNLHGKCGRSLRINWFDGVYVLGKRRPAFEPPGGPRRCQLMRQIPCFFQLKKLGHYCRCLFTLLPRLHTFLRIFTSTSNNRLLTRDKLSKT
jgi:hypothetical protein